MRLVRFIQAVALLVWHLTLPFIVPSLSMSSTSSTKSVAMRCADRLLVVQQLLALALIVVTRKRHQVVHFAKMATRSNRKSQKSQPSSKHVTIALVMRVTQAAGQTTRAETATLLSTANHQAKRRNKSIPRTQRLLNTVVKPYALSLAFRSAK